MAQQDEVTRGNAALEAAAAQLPDDAALPIRNLDLALPHLRRPFSAEAIRFKVQTAFPKANPTGCIIVAYIDARLTIERLNAVVGGDWSATYAAVSDPKLLRCDLTVCGVTRCDIGESSKGMSKDLLSDALKRAAVHFGVGVSVYALPQVMWSLERNAGGLKPKQQGDKKTLALTDQGHSQLRASYAQWLTSVGARAFGEALDHGDTFEDVDAAAEVVEEEFVPAVPEALEDERAIELQKQANTLYLAIDKKSLPPAQFNAWLRQSSHSHEALEQLIAHLRERAA